MNFLHTLKSFLLSLYYRVRYSTRPVEEPAQLYIDENGVPWPRHPGYQDADQPDEGQHDIWKKDMRIFLWRTIHGPEQPGSMPLEPLGFGRRSETVPVLFPVGEQLAAQCRKLGFRNLALASMPEAREEEIRRAYELNEAAVRVEARVRRQRGERTASTWDAPRMGYDYQYDEEAQTVAQLTLGPLEPVMGATPLRPLNLQPSQSNLYTRFTKVRS